MNGNMDIALGAAIVAVDGTQRFHSKKIYFNDGPNQEYKLKIIKDDVTKTIPLFNSKTPYNQRKELQFKNQKQNLTLIIINEKEKFEKQYFIYNANMVANQYSKDEIKDA